MLIPWQSHHGVEACIPGLSALSGGDGTKSVLEYILSDACRLMRQLPFVPSS
jgi:hypothetical protein